MSFVPLSRRGMLRATAGSCAAAAAANLLPGCGFDVDAAQELPVLADANGVITLNLSAAPRLSAVGNAVILVQDGTSTTVPLPVGGVIVARLGERQFAAVKALCTHQSCPLGYAADERKFACPCHGSRFYAESVDGKCVGDVSRGPAVFPAQAFLTSYDAATSKLTIDITRTPTCESLPDVFIPSVLNGKVVLPLDKVPQLLTAGGSYIAQPQGHPDTLAVVRVDATTVVVLSAICTHQGCTVDYSTTAKDLECGCHGSTYNLTGAVTGGPATSPLTKYTAVLDAQSITITVS